MTVPETRYAKSHGAYVAYQVHGKGAVDLLAIHDWASCVDAHWEHPGHLRWEQVLESVARVIEFDQRGIGASDRLPAADVGRLQDWVDDAVAVMDAVGCERAVVHGEGLGGHAALLLAVAHPERVERLVLVNSHARSAWGEDYPFGLKQGDVDNAVAWVERTWGSGRVIGTASTGLGTHIDVCGRLERMSSTPGVAAAWVRASYTSDVRSLCERVTVPTLVLNNGDYRFLEPEHGRYLADHIPGARLLEGQETSFYWGDGNTDEYLAFITGQTPEVGERELATVLFTDIVGSTARAVALGDDRWRMTLDHVDDFVRRQIERFGGRMVKHTGDGHLATFPSPGAAVRGAAAIVAGVKVLEVSVRVGVHTGEILRRPDGDVTGIAVNACARIAAHAGSDEVLVSRTVADLVAGSGIVLTDRGTYALKGVPGDWPLFLASA